MQPMDVTYRQNNRLLRIRRTDPDNPASRAIEVRIEGGEWAREYEMMIDREDADFEHAVEVARQVWGPGKRGGRAGCTNSMIHEIWSAMRHVAGC
jgi:hypothetical protein